MYDSELLKVGGLSTFRNIDCLSETEKFDSTACRFNAKKTIYWNKFKICFLVFYLTYKLFAVLVAQFVSSLFLYEFHFLF